MTVHAIARLRAHVAYLAELPDGGGETGGWLCGVVAEYEVGARLGVRLDELVGLLPGPGRESWHRIEDRAQRDAWLRDLAQEMFVDGPSLRRQPMAKEIARQLLRYETSAWRHDQQFLAPPSGCSRIRAIQFRVLKINGTAPSWQTVERALGRRRATKPRFS